MTPRERKALRLKIEIEWLKAREGYEAAGKPFGEGRGVDLWIEYGQCTTAN